MKRISVSVPTVCLLVSFISACRRSEAALGALGSELANAHLVALAGPPPPDSAKGIFSKCPTRLRDTRTGLEWWLQRERLVPTDSVANPRLWPHEGDYEIAYQDHLPGHASAWVRISCSSLTPLGIVKRGA